MFKTTLTQLGLIFAVVLVISQMFIVDAFAQTSSISGIVFGAGGRPVPSVNVELLNDTYSTLRRVKTNGTGLYSFRGLQSGYYYVRVLPYGTNYLEDTQRVSLVGMSAVVGRGAVSQQVNFRLVVKRDINANPLAPPGVIFVQKVPDEAETLFKKGIKLLKANEEKEGFDSVKKAIELFPNYFAALDRLGYEYMIRGYYRPSYVLLSKALEVNPKSFTSKVAFGITQFKLNLVGDSIVTLQGAVNLFKESVYANMWLGIAQFKNGDFTNAEESLEKANKLSKGKSANVHYQLARVYEKQKRYGEAAKSLELYLKYNPKSKNAEKIKRSVENLKNKITT